jgi:putative glutamine amidotransferase
MKECGMISMQRRPILLFILLCLLFSCGSPDRDTGDVKIGVTYGTAQAVASFLRIDLNDDYRRAVQAFGGHVVELSVFADHEEIDAALGTLDGVLIPGGLDVEPHRYGEAEHEELEATDGRLDELEFRVLDYARENSLPVLAICRGHQVLNVFRGGSLYQDIHLQHQQESTPTVHRITDEGWIRDTPLPCYHDVEIKRDSKLYQMLQTENVKVNSYHHQAVKRLGEGLAISALTPDGLVEAFEGSGERFVVGVQFHPEMMLAENALFEKIFESFASASRSRGARRLQRSLAQP